MIPLYIFMGSCIPVSFKYAFNQGWGNFLFGFSRFTFIGLFFLIIVIIKKRTIFGDTPRIRKYILLGAFFRTVNISCFYLAINIIPISRAITIATFAPIITLVLIHFFLENEEVKLKHIIGISISFIGLIIFIFSRYINLDFNSIISNEYFVADVLIIFQLICFRTVVIFEKKALNQGASPIQLIAPTSLIPAIAFLILAIINGQSYSDVPTNYSTILIFLYAIIPGGIFWFYFRRELTKKTEVSYLNSFSHLTHGLGIIASAIFLGEEISKIMIICFALITLGTLISSGKIKIRS